ncbi:MAG: hypothetical protein QOC70_93 [Verrucomicrobiota bacterium]
MNQPRPWPIIFRRALVFGLWSLPAICAFYMMWTHWVSVPFWDEWDTPGGQLASYYRGTLTFAELCSQHNEHRLLFPRLIWLPLAIVTGWDVRHGMVLTFCFVCLGSAGLYQLLRSANGTAAGRAFVFGLMNLVLFSPRQYETFLVGAQGQTFVPTFLLVLALLVNLSGKSLPTKTIMNAAIAQVSAYSFGNGMLVWLFAFPLETRSADLPASRPTQRIFWRAVYVLMAGLSVASYFISYRHPSAAPPVVSPIAQLPAFLRFVLVWIGSLFSVGAPAICGAVVLFLFGGLAAMAIWQMRRGGNWRLHYPWLVLGCYTVISGCVAAIARLGFDYSMAGDARYTAFSAFLYIAVLGLGLSVYTEMKPRAFTARIALSAALVSLAVILTLWAITFQKERRLLGIFTPAWKHSLLVLRWSAAIPQNPEIHLLSPYPLQQTVETIHTLAENDALRPRLVSQRLANAILERPNTDATSAGSLDEARLESTGNLVFQGWARVPDRARPADCVVLGFETSDGGWKPFCVVETGGSRPDLARHFGIGALAHAGFSGRMDASSIPRGDITMKAWAIDLQNERALPMGGSIRLQRRP